MSVVVVRFDVTERMRHTGLFLIVGGAAFVVDIGLFNALAAADIGVLNAKAVSTAVSILVAYIGNRYLAFRSRRSRHIGREAVLFMLANAAGGSAALASLGVSHYLLGFDSAFADNIAGNVIGVLLGTLIRYLLYQSVVFRNGPEE